MGLLERTPDGPRITRAWAGRTVVCLASGPSVTREDIDLLRAARERDAIRLVAVNDMYLVAPFADVCYFADAPWCALHKAGLPRTWPWIAFTAEDVREAWASFKGERVTIKHVDSVEDSAVFVMKKGQVEGLSVEADTLNTGKNSGYQSLNLATLAGGNPVLLVGYDMGYIGGRTHSHNGHKDKMPAACYWEYAQKFVSVQNPLKAIGVKVVNCSMGSTLAMFPKVLLEKALRA